MTGGAIAAVVLVVLGSTWQWWLHVAAAVVYVACTAYGGWYFISTASKRGDQTRTVED